MEEYNVTDAGQELAGALGGVTEKQLTAIYRALSEAYEAGEENEKNNDEPINTRSL